MATPVIYDSICMSNSSLGETSREAGPAYIAIHFFLILQIPTNKTKGAISPCQHADMPDMMANSCWWQRPGCGSARWVEMNPGR